MAEAALSDADLLKAHSELLQRAKAARAQGDLDTAQTIIAAIRPLNAEMARRMGR